MRARARHVCVSTRCEHKRPAPSGREGAERVALVACARRQALLHAHRHRLRADDLEDCLSQATIELVSRARTGAPFSGTAHIANALEQRFLSRINDRRRALGGRSPMQARLEHALVLDVLEDEGRAVPDPRAGTEELVELRLQLQRLPEVARALSPDQQLVLACQVGLQMSPATFCATHGWSAEKYRKVAQRARARLRALSESAQEGVPFAAVQVGVPSGSAQAGSESAQEGVPFAVGRSEEEKGTHL